MKSIHILFFIPILLTCCFPASVLQVIPVNEDVKWRNGYQMVTKQLNGVSCELTFLRTEGEYFIYDVNIINNSNKSVLVAPDNFYLVPSPQKVGIPKKINSIDPMKYNPDQDNILKKTTLEPNYSVAGLIIFPKFKYCNQLTLYLTLDEIKFSWYYQVVYL
jgi:hypothetical protein